MTFLARLLRFLFLLAFITWGVRIFARLLSALFRPSQPSKPREPQRDLHATSGARVLVRDPVCGVHLAEVLAIPLRASNGQLLYFCSTNCRDSYMDSSRTLAANG
jgi:YHS domain-containing protein